MLRTPILGACAIRSSRGVGLIQLVLSKPERSLVVGSSAAAPGTTIRGTSAPRTATGTTQTTGTTMSASGWPERLSPEPPGSRSRRACMLRSGPFMTSGRRWWNIDRRQSGACLGPPGGRQAPSAHRPASFVLPPRAARRLASPPPLVSPGAWVHFRGWVNRRRRPPDIPRPGTH